MYTYTFIYTYRIHMYSDLYLPDSAVATGWFGQLCPWPWQAGRSGQFKTTSPTSPTS